MDFFFTRPKLRHQWGKSTGTTLHWYWQYVLVKFKIKQQFPHRPKGFVFHSATVFCRHPTRELRELMAKEILAVSVTDVVLARETKRFLISKTTEQTAWSYRKCRHLAARRRRKCRPIKNHCQNINKWHWKQKKMTTTGLWQVRIEETYILVV